MAKTKIMNESVLEKPSVGRQGSISRDCPSKTQAFGHSKIIPSVYVKDLESTHTIPQAAVHKYNQGHLYSFIQYLSVNIYYPVIYLLKISFSSAGLS